MTKSSEQPINSDIITAMNRLRLRKVNNLGFTLIELFIVGVIACILGTIVGMTYSSVRSAERNDARQASMDVLKGQLETYYAQTTKYPSLAELNNTKWRSLNLKGVEDKDLRDPQWNNTVKECTTNGNPVFSGEAQKQCYAYHATTSDGLACEDTKVTCAQYTLTTILEGGEKYVKSSLN